MAYVFGMNNVPVFEMMFIMIALQLFGIGFLFFEIRKLISLIAKEKTDISRFEADLAEFERVEGKKPPQKLLNVVQDARSQGIPDNHITNTLDSQGWQKHEINHIMGKTF